MLAFRRSISLGVVEWAYGMSGYDTLVILRKDLMPFTSRQFHPHHFLGQLRSIHQNSLPTAYRNRQAITFHLSPPWKGFLKVFIFIYGYQVID